MLSSFPPLLSFETSEPTAGAERTSPKLTLKTRVKKTVVCFKHTVRKPTLRSGVLAIHSLILPVPERKSLKTEPSGAKLVSSGTSLGRHTPPYGAPTRRPYLRLRKHSAVEDTRYRT